jgi:hypothetical protein
LDNKILEWGRLLHRFATFLFVNLVTQILYKKWPKIEFLTLHINGQLVCRLCTGAKLRKNWKSCAAIPAQS